MNITIKQLEVFLAIAKHENLSKAAEELYITKGAVSQSLQELEKQFNIRLFDRVHPNIRLNHEGKRLRPLADEILHRMKEVNNLFNKEKEHFLKIGVSKTIGTHLLPRLFANFQENFHWLPKAYIANTTELLELLETFTVDAILLEGYVNHNEINIEPWLDDEMAVFSHKNHKLADGKTHKIQELKRENWILREPNSGTREFFEQSLGQLIYPYEVTQTLDTPESVLGMVEQGLGITFISKLIAELPKNEDRFGIIQLDKKFTRTLSICYHKKKYHSQSMDQFLNFCRVWQLS